MLVLSRKEGEKIYIGDDIVITVILIDRGKVRIGIEAPKDVPIYRQELLPLNFKGVGNAKSEEQSRVQSQEAEGIPSYGSGLEGAGG